MAACSAQSARPAAATRMRARAASRFFSASNDKPASLYSCSSTQASFSLASCPRPHAANRLASRVDLLGVVRRRAGRNRVAGAETQIEDEREAVPPR